MTEYVSLILIPLGEGCNPLICPYHQSIRLVKFGEGWRRHTLQNEQGFQKDKNIGTMFHERTLFYCDVYKNNAITSYVVYIVIYHGFLTHVCQLSYIVQHSS